MSVGSFMESKILPFAAKISENKVIRSIQMGAMATLPLTLGTVLIAITYNLPFAPWTSFLANSGLGTHMNALITTTSSITGLYMTLMIGYFNASLRGKSGVTGAILALGSFLALNPHTIPVGEAVASGFDFNYLGANGIFGGIIIAILITSLYVALDTKGLVVKLPSSVPPMVAQSLSPTFIAIILFTFVLFTRWGFGLTQYGNIFDAISQTVGRPIVALGSNPINYVIFWMVTNLFWFFGIHPMTLFSVYMPVLMTVGVTNLTAFLAGQPMPYHAFSSIGAFMMMGGTGATLGLALILPFVSKSARYKALGKIALVPSVFNINEPLIFGLPIMLNPLFLTPMLLVPVVNGLLAYIGYSLGLFTNFNPSVALPWITPGPFTAFLQTGLGWAIVCIVVIVADALLYYPFLLAADKIALKEESEAEALA